MVGLPPWIREAKRWLGQREVAGTADNGFIVDCLRRVGLPDQHDETAWCAAFACRCIDDAGLKSPRTAAARGFLPWGVALPSFRLGAVAVFRRVDPAQPTIPHGHVAFALCDLDDRVVILGGNQGNAVSVETRLATDLLGYRWPLGVP